MNARCIDIARGAAVLAYQQYWMMTTNRAFAAAALTCTLGCARKPSIKAITKTDNSSSSISVTGCVTGAGRPGMKAVGRPGRGRFEHLVRRGVWTYWHDNGRRRSQGGMVRGNKSGLWRTWYASGSPRQEGAYTNGKAMGAHRFWHPSSSPIWTRATSAAPFLRRTDDLVPSGQLRSKGRYHQGRREGPWTEWYGSGQRRCAVSFQQGKRRPGATYWTVRGEPLGAEAGSCLGEPVKSLNCDESSDSPSP